MHDLRFQASAIEQWPIEKLVPFAANAIKSFAGNAVGAGVKPSALIEDAGLKAEVQRLWLDWTDEADAEGFTDFYGLQRRAARELYMAGEVFVVQGEPIRDGERLVWTAEVVAP